MPPQPARLAFGQVVDQPEEADAEQEDEPAAGTGGEGKPGRREQDYAEREEHGPAAVVRPPRH
jgi:hypothetical protein